MFNSFHDLANLFQKLEKAPEDHVNLGGLEGLREILGELWLQLHHAAARKNSRSPIISPIAFATTVLREEYRRIHWRERDQANRHSPRRDNSESNLESGVAIDLLGHSSNRTPLQEDIHDEDCSRLLSFANELSETDRQLLGSLSEDSTKGVLHNLARQKGCSLRTLQRRRKELRQRIHRLLDS